MTKDNENRGANLCSEHIIELPALSITFGFTLADMFCTGEVKPLVLPCIHPFAQVAYLILQLSFSNPQMLSRRVALRSLQISQTAYRMVKQRSKIDFFGTIHGLHDCNMWRSNSSEPDRIASTQWHCRKSKSSPALSLIP